MRNFLLMALLPLVFSCANISRNEKAGDFNQDKNRGDSVSDESELLAFTVYGSRHLAAVMLPDTWTVDMDMARRLDSAGFFYRKKYTTGNTPAAIILTITENMNPDASLKDFINFDFNNNFSDFPGRTEGQQLDWDIKNKNNYTVEIFKIENDQLDFLQYTAYIDAGLHYFSKIALAVIDQNNYAEELHDFKRCIENSTFSGIGLQF